MAKQLGVGVVGVGTLGRFHARNLAQKIPAARLTAIAEIRPDVARSVADELGVTKIYATAGELAGDPDVEAVVIVSDDSAHMDGILAAAANRKDVFCEKPIATTLADADRAIAAVGEAGVRLQIGFMRRYDPPFLAAKEAIEAGRIGTPAFFKNAHRGRDPFGTDRPAAAGVNPNAFTNSNIHDYNDARWLLDDEAEEVTATGTRLVAPTAPEGIECAVTTVKFRRGALADIEFVSATRYGYDTRTEVIGDLGTVFIGSTNGMDCVVATADGMHQQAMDHWLNRYGQTYLTEMEDWVRRMLAGEPPLVTAQDGRAALEIAAAAQISLREGRAVRLPLTQ